MMFRSSCIVAILSLYQTTVSTVDAFTIRRTTTTTTTANNQLNVVAGPDRSPFSVPRSTCLSMAAEDETTEESAETEDGGAADPNDILNSPAFLKRKLEVLESDIVTAEEDLVLATENKEVAKEEWGPQLEALQREVSNMWSSILLSTVLMCCDKRR